ncbi:hypothetical protein PI172_1311 [Prevotella intermedia]|uniref:Uncharacterized protein n=1 Tax=Prevotella intermedia TaxID=28131 RepID=A0AAD1BI58_PREIN|nr:hypothetical protein PIN17_A1372 [Prevotella intermedia 17]BAR96039.1 hypothetical protein PI172_1311 [Prevotella intermedia]
MHGKSGSFATQNLRFRNVKTKLPFFDKIIFTKSRQFYILIIVEEKKTKNAKTQFLNILEVVAVNNLKTYFDFV